MCVREGLSGVVLSTVFYHDWSLTIHASTMHQSMYSYTGALRGGVVLVANPKAFLQGQLDPELARRFFLPTDLSLEVGVRCGAVMTMVDAKRGAAAGRARTHGNQSKRMKPNPTSHQIRWWAGWALRRWTIWPTLSPSSSSSVGGGCVLVGLCHRCVLCRSAACHTYTCMQCIHLTSEDGSTPSLGGPCLTRPTPTHHAHNRERATGHDGAGAEPTHGLLGGGLERGLLRCALGFGFSLGLGLGLGFGLVAGVKVWI